MQKYKTESVFDNVEFFLKVVAGTDESFYILSKFKTT